MFCTRSHHNAVGHRGQTKMASSLSTLTLCSILGIMGTGEIGRLRDPTCKVEHPSPVLMGRVPKKGNRSTWHTFSRQEHLELEQPRNEKQFD